MPAVAANRGGVNMRILARVLVSMFVVALVLATNAGTNYAASVIKGPRLSQIALLSKFAHDNMPDEAIDLAKLDAAMPDFGLPGGSPAAAQINPDVTRRPQNETSIAIKPGPSGETATWITGANDYGIGAPIGSGVYPSGGTTYFPPFPLLAYKGGSGSQLWIEVPIAGGEPCPAYRKKRHDSGLPAVGPRRVRA